MHQVRTAVGRQTTHGRRSIRRVDRRSRSRGQRRQAGFQGRVGFSIRWICRFFTRHFLPIRMGTGVTSWDSNLHSCDRRTWRFITRFAGRIMDDAGTIAASGPHPTWGKSEVYLIVKTSSSRGSRPVWRSISSVIRYLGDILKGPILQFHHYPYRTRSSVSETNRWRST